ncbi:hypothetical protein JW796_00035 [Candidatus Dojkabacteria bacterium]|nr:hypothetical protein [Candidatus Dojkabacteria bacterium]
MVVSTNTIKPQEINENYRLEIKESVVGINKLRLINTKENTKTTLISWFGYRGQYPVEWMQLSSGDFIVIIKYQIGMIDSKNGKLVKLTGFPNYYSPGSYKLTVL